MLDLVVLVNVKGDVEKIKKVKTDRQTDRQIERQTDRQKDRQIDI